MNRSRRPHSFSRAYSRTQGSSPGPDETPTPPHYGMARSSFLFLSSRGSLSPGLRLTRGRVPPLQIDDNPQPLVRFRTPGKPRTHTNPHGPDDFPVFVTKTFSRRRHNKTVVQSIRFDFTATFSLGTEPRRKAEKSKEKLC